jgi:hypothetical protein
LVVAAGLAVEAGVGAVEPPPGFEVRVGAVVVGADVCRGGAVVVAPVGPVVRVGPVDALVLVPVFLAGPVVVGAAGALADPGWAGAGVSCRPDGCNTMATEARMSSSGTTTAAASRAARLRLFGSAWSR